MLNSSTFINIHCSTEKHSIDQISLVVNAALLPYKDIWALFLQIDLEINMKFGIITFCTYIILQRNIEIFSCIWLVRFTSVFVVFAQVFAQVILLFKTVCKSFRKLTKKKKNSTSCFSVKCSMFYRSLIKFRQISHTFTHLTLED